MRIRAIRLFPGPNVYSHNPVVLTEVEGNLDAFEQSARQLAQKVGVVLQSFTPRTTSFIGPDEVLFEYESEAGARGVLELATCSSISDEQIQNLRRKLSHGELGPSTRAIVQAAESRSIPWRRLGDQNVVQLGYGRNRRRIEAALSTNSSCIAVDIAANKQLTKEILSAADIPCPRGRQAESEQELRAAMDHLRAPLVVKPLDACQGKGVTLHLRTPEQVLDAFSEARKYSDIALIEEQLQGSDYRVLVIGGTMQAASLRTPAQVSGDGVQTIALLIEDVNRNPLRGEGHECVMTKIHVDAPLIAVLERQGLTLDSVPAEGERIILRDSANLSTGGEAEDVTDLVHPEIRAMCERAARVIGLDICGIDLIAEDIAHPLNEDGGIVEVNASPGLRMHIAPVKGLPRDVGRAIVESLYPRSRESRIPIISVTGTNGKTTVTRMIAHVLQDTGQTVGMTSTDGIWIDGQRVSKGDTTGPRSAWTVLSDPSVEVAVLETARGGIVRRGLGYDWSDVAVLTNIQPDHLGQDRIESVEDILDIKSLVAERVRPGGTVILNADDPILAALPSHSRMADATRQIVFFSMDWKCELLRRHLSQGNKAYFLRDGWIVEGAGVAERWIARVSDLPITLGGLARHQVQNAVAAIAACRAQGVSTKAIAASLRTFRATMHNAGRGNLYRIGEAYVMLDYGHNASAFDAMAFVANNWPHGRVAAVIGMPGDRTDELIRHGARAAVTAFDRIVIREDNDLRGRAPGEIAAIIEEEAQKAGVEYEICLGTLQAVTRATEALQPGDLAIVFYEKLEEILECLLASGAQPATELPWTPRVVQESELQTTLLA